MKTLLYILDCSSSPLCCFPVSLPFVTQSAVAVLSSAVSSGGVECVALLGWGFRLWWTWMKRGYALCNSQSANIVLPLAGIHNTFLARFRVSMAAAGFAFVFFFFLQESSASTTFVTGTKTLALKAATVPSHHLLLIQLSWNTLCVYGAHAALALEVIVLLSCTWPCKCFVEWNYLFVCSKQVYTLTLCRHLGLRWAVCSVLSSLCAQTVYRTLRSFTIYICGCGNWHDN